MRIAAHSLLCLLLLASCDTERQAEPVSAGEPVRPTVQDSGGIAIYEHSAGARSAAPQFTVDTAALTVIGAREDGSDDVTWVMSVVLLSDGAIAYWDDRQSQLAVHEADGRVRRRIGRRGQGPEDFGSIHSLASTADTLIVLDSRNDRVAFYGPSLKRIDALSGVTACGEVSLVGRLKSGDIVADEGRGLRLAPVSDSILRPPAALVRFDGQGCDTLAVLPGREIRVIEARQRGRSFPQTVPVMFGRAPAAALWDTMIAVGTADAYQIDLLSEHGVISRSIRIDIGRTAMPPGARDSLIARRRSQAGSGGERALDPIEQERHVREATIVADSVAPYERFFVTSNGLLWVLEGWAPGMPERSATAFRTDGNIVGHLRIPAALIPMAFGSDRVLVRAEDPETGIVTFRSLRLIPRSP